MSDRRPPEEVRRLFEAKAAWHRRQARLPLIERRRPLRAWEKPWPIVP
ncbi:MAG: hypothetical protein KBD01_09375 [Acidobacteria bacterium]|nr:hypothetical protein [Acidobacteriota bacterium]